MNDIGARSILPDGWFVISLTPSYLTSLNNDRVNWLRENAKDFAWFYVSNHFYIKDEEVATMFKLKYSP